MITMATQRKHHTRFYTSQQDNKSYAFWSSMLFLMKMDNMKNQRFGFAVFTLLVVTHFFGKSLGNSGDDDAVSSVPPLGNSGDYEYEYEYEEAENTDATTNGNFFTHPITDENFGIADVKNDLGDLEVITGQPNRSQHEFDILLNPGIFSDFANNEQQVPSVESIEEIEKRGNSKVVDIPSELVPVEQEFAVAKRQDNSTIADGKKTSNNTKPIKGVNGTNHSGSVKTTRRPRGYKIGNIIDLDDIVRRVDKHKHLVMVQLPTTQPPQKKDTKKVVQEPSDYFISEGVDDTLQESRLSDADELESFKLRDFYYGCNDEKSCFGGPENCTQQKSCEVAVTYQPKPELGGVLIELLGKTPKYVALGLSIDQKMGGDNVIDCVRENDQVRIYRSVNKGRQNNRLSDHSAIFNKVGYYRDLWLYCSFILKKKTSIKLKGNITKKMVFDLEADNYYLLLARGNSAESREQRVGIAYHDLGTLVSWKKYNLMKFGESKVRSLFERLHGICIVVGWLLLLPISTFVIRYHKNTCHEKYVGNLSIWFAVHLSLNGIVVGLTIAAIVLITFASGEFQIGIRGWTRHNISATLFCACVLIQVCLGISIYARRHSKHNATSCVHAILGHVTFLLSYFIIYKSKDMRHGLPCASFPILVTWIVIYFVIHLILSYQVCYVDFIQGKDSARIYQFTGLAPSAVTDVDPEPPGGLVRKALLWILIVSSVATTAALIVLQVTGYPDCIRQAEDE